ncbi:TetR/AcrR family transcriptional regulator [Halosquirtibacter laminarini]|uniref:TetR/AcrR family transcriptional regulator n=1 Tax=Halosquirtibacter laminarini TaxID=3374600 RepID=A0AC61NKL0_9BACT|nr:TetR/AcrR family transcriptional regulator [Prolixibacteraceae bacterium]
MEIDRNIEERILFVAEKVFMKNGFKSTTMNMIAKEVGISRTSLNYYFRSKERLYSRLLDGMINRFIPRLGSYIGTTDDIYDVLDYWVDEYTKLLIEHPSYPFFIISEIERNQENLASVVRNSLYEFGIIERVSEITIRQFGVQKMMRFNSTNFIIKIISIILGSVIISPTIRLVLGDHDSLMEEYLLSSKTQNKILVREIFNNFLNEKVEE